MISLVSSQQFQMPMIMGDDGEDAYPMVRRELYCRLKESDTEAELIGVPFSPIVRAHRSK